MLNDLSNIPSLNRIETVSREDMEDTVTEMTHTVYPHDQLYGQFCPVQSYINCPPDLVYAYMSHVKSLEEWTFSTRNFKPLENGLWVGEDRLEADTKIYCRVEANGATRVVDYHCAWDQGDVLWMIYLTRIVDAKQALNREGSVVFWQNCRHPYYDDNPFPELAPKGRSWVGDFWDLFPAGHMVELQNLKSICEYRYAQSLPMATW